MRTPTIFLSVLMFVVTPALANAKAADDSRLLMQLVANHPIQILYVGELDPAAKKVGLSDNSLLDSIELALRRNNIPVSDGANAWDPRLTVSATVIRVGTSKQEVGYVYHLSLSLFVMRRSVLFAAEKGSAWIPGLIWGNNVTGFTATPERIPVMFRNWLSVQTDALSLEYLQAASALEAHFGDSS